MAHAHHNMSIQVMCYLYTESNGATRLVPGSHLWDDEREPTEAESVQAIMPKGSVCVFVGGVYHGGSHNVTAGEWRIGMFAGYILGWLRQEQNFASRCHLKLLARYRSRSLD